MNPFVVAAAIQTACEWVFCIRQKTQANQVSIHRHFIVHTISRVPPISFAVSFTVTIISKEARNVMRES